MTEQEYIELRDEVAQLYKVSFGELMTWNGLMPLAIEHGVGYDPNHSDYVMAFFDVHNDYDYRIWQRQITEKYKDHPTKELAVSISILKALKAKKEK